MSVHDRIEYAGELAKYLSAQSSAPLSPPSETLAAAAVHSIRPRRFAYIEQGLDARRILSCL